MSASDQNNVDNPVISSSAAVDDIDENDNKKALISKDKLEPSLGDPEYYMKHPLQNTWALWFFKNDRTKRWEDNLRLVTKFDTVEDFWALYNHIQLSSRLQMGCDYNLFKDGVQPMWEDSENKNGGKWLLQLTKQQRQSELDRCWLETLLCLIGEGFGADSDEVNGGVVNVRHRGDKTALWTKTTSKASMMRIGEIYKSRLGLPRKVSIVFQSHKDTMTKTGSTAKNMFHV